MNRKTFDPDAADDAAPAPLDLAPRRPCRWCSGSTLVSMLTQYGARCLPCYEAYCRGAHLPAVLADKKRDGSKAWAWALKALEEGDPALVTPAQSASWRAALAADLAQKRLAGEEAAA